MKFGKKIIACLLILFVLISMTGCGGVGKEATSTLPAEGNTKNTGTDGNSIGSNTQSSTNAPKGIQLNLKAATPVQFSLENYNGSFFTMKIPKGWRIETTGDYENFGFHLFDPNKPARKIFFYGSMSPFLKSNEARDAWKMYLNQGGFGNAQLYSEAPILSPATTKQFFYKFNEFASLANRYGINHRFPLLSKLEIIESNSRNSPIASVAKDDSVVRGLFVQDETPCEGLFGASVVDAMSSYMYNVDAGFYTVYVITGIAAPADEFYLLKDTLGQSLGSFQFSQSYIQQGVAQNAWETQAALQVGKTLSEAYDSYNKAWSNRQVVNDTLSQKRSDATLGYDRLKDTVTGDVYRAELGFYDQYKTKPEEYSNPNLELVPDKDYASYGKPLAGYIYK